ncbi:MAG TPA: OmpA family protein [Anaerolineae bacterium]|nr:OmpA family protein [Anaerolineae bacterium]
MSRFLFVTAITIQLALTGSANADAQTRNYSLTVEGGHGLMYMQSARTSGKGTFAFGAKTLVMQRETTVIEPSGYSLKKKDFPTIVSIPVTFGLTDEIDLTACFYNFFDARSWQNMNNVTEGYGAPRKGTGVSRFGVKIRWPFPMDSPVHIAGKFGALFDTSSEQLDGLNYRWTRTGTDIETSLYETFDIGSFMSLHFEQGYVLSGTDIFDDQYIGGIGFEIHLLDRLDLNIELNNRTFLGKSPQSLLKAGNEPEHYFELNGVSAIGNPKFLKDKTADFMEDFFIASPSARLRLSDTITIDIGANINIADQVDPKETFQIVGGITFIRHINSMIDSDGDGIKNNIDIELHTPRGFPVDTYGRSLDTDKDGVPDGIDREFDTPLGAHVNSSGVGMDTDGDGVFDGLDMEPQTPIGCPVDRFGVALDDDRDGVPNGLDLESDTQKGAVVNQNGISIDEDGDGVPNGLDMEPDTPVGVEVDLNGVSRDNDGDGVPDGLDEEPNTPKGILVDKKGRALIKQDFSLLSEGLILLNTIYFASGDTQLNPDSYHIIDEIGQLMIKYPTLIIQIEGHSDSIGNKVLNMKLARERANAVIEYLLQRYPILNRERFRVVGFGSEKPIASNNTFQGRQLNRRVEFVIINPDDSLR